MSYSTNEMAEKIMGNRRTDGIILNLPCETGYHCPVCEYENLNKEEGEYDMRLDWSEYNGFIWCSVCDKDYPSALCQPDIDKAINTYLSSVLDSQRLKGHNFPDEEVPWEEPNVRH